MMDNRCVICGREGVAGLSILGRAICPECEKEIVSSNAADTQYDSFLSRLRDISLDAAKE